MSKVTIGNGCFLLTNVGVRPIMSNSWLISTVAFKLAGGPTFFGLEGSVGCAGQALDWLNVGLGMAREEVVGLQEEDGCGDSASIWSEGCSAPGRDQMLQVLYPCTPPLSSTSCRKRQRP